MYMNDGNKTKINLRNKSVFITGVAGFIGSNLAKRLLSTVEDVKVVGLDNMNHYYDVRLKEARLNELEQFENFSFVKGKQKTRPYEITVIDDGTSTDETRLGAVKDIQLAVEKLNLALGFDGEATRKMRTFLQGPKPELLHHQKFFENGTAERAKESGTEQNYNMIDGCVNNVPKKPRRIGGRWSVLDRLHIKQAERRQKDNTPQQEQERSRKS